MRFRGIEDVEEHQVVGYGIGGLEDLGEWLWSWSEEW